MRNRDGGSYVNICADYRLTPLDPNRPFSPR